MAAPAFITIGLLGRALKHADMLAFQRFQRRLNRRAFGGNQARVGGVELVREGDFLLAFFRNRQRRDDSVDFLGLQRRDQGVEIAANPATFYFNTRTELIAQINVKTHEIPFRILRRERRVGGIGANANTLRQRGERAGGAANAHH